MYIYRASSPHATTVLESVGPTLQRPTKMTMHLIPPLPTLIQKRQFEQSPNIGPFAGQSHEQRNIGSIILGAFAIGVEIYGPQVAPNHEGIGSYVLSDSDPLGESVAADFELVGAISGVCVGGGGGEGLGWRKGWLSCWGFF